MVNKLLVYVAGPFRGASRWAEYQNIQKAEAVAWKVWEAGAVALCPHLNTAHFQNSLPDNVWLEGDIIMLERCDVMIMVEGWEKSVGATEERRIAIERNIPVVYTIEELKRLIHEAEDDGA